ncbi:MAG: dephospho-CoA kinase [Bacteroidaceae bacterium]|nr:dephospho-CoA kinase [Bacteroidaceae bacterium]
MIATRPTTFNIGQLHILEMLNRCNTEKSLKELKKALFDFYSKEVDAEADRLWESGVISGEKIEEWGKQHMRTPYIHA